MLKSCVPQVVTAAERQGAGSKNTLSGRWVQAHVDAKHLHFSQYQLKEPCVGLTLALIDNLFKSKFVQTWLFANFIGWKLAC